MINLDVALGKLAINIQLGKDIDFQYNIDTEEEKIALCNVLFLSYRNKYNIAYTTEDKQNILEELIAIYKRLFLKKNINFISLDLLKILFTFGNVNDFQTTNFREMLVKLFELNKTCDYKIVNTYIYKKIISIILHAGLYSKEPYLSILSESIENIEKSNIEEKYIYQVRFLE